MSTVELIVLKNHVYLFNRHLFMLVLYHFAVMRGVVKIAIILKESRTAGESFLHKI